MVCSQCDTLSVYTLAECVHLYNLAPNSSTCPHRARTLQDRVEHTRQSVTTMQLLMDSVYSTTTICTIRYHSLYGDNIWMNIWMNLTPADCSLMSRRLKHGLGVKHSVQLEEGCWVCVWVLAQLQTVALPCVLVDGVAGGHQTVQVV